jgi:hypothetical protein
MKVLVTMWLGNEKKESGEEWDKKGMAQKVIKVP